MAQTWALPFADTTLLSNTDEIINDGFKTLRTTYIGTADPTVPVVEDGQIWINTTANKVRAHKGSTTIDLGDWAAELGHLRSDGTIDLTGDQSAGGFKLTNLAAPVATTDAVRLSELTNKLDISGSPGTMNAGALLSYQGAPVLTALNLTHKSYVDTKLALAGGTMTGDLSLPVNNTPPADAALRKDFIENMGFSTTIGHRHGGTNSRKVLGTSLDSAATAANQSLTANGDGTSSWRDRINYTPRGSRILVFTWTRGVDAGATWLIVDLDSTTTPPPGATAVFLQMESTAGGIRHPTVSLRKDGDTSVGIPYQFKATSGDSNILFSDWAIIEISSTNRFNIKVDPATGTSTNPNDVLFYAIAYFED